MKIESKRNQLKIRNDLPWGGYGYFLKLTFNNEYRFHQHDMCIFTNNILCAVPFFSQSYH